MASDAVTPIEALARVPLPVVVVSADSGGARGCSTGTVSYLSLKPPLLMTALAPSSATLALIRESGRFAVSVLADDQADLATRAGARGVTADKFAELGIASFSRPGWPPAIADCAAVLWCMLEDTRAYGDHVLCVGRIVEAEAGGRGSMTRFLRRYHAVGAPLDVERESPYPL